MSAPITYAPQPAEWSYTFGGREPVAFLRPDDVFTADTEDCFGGLVRTVDDLPSLLCPMPYLNPVSGPFFIEDAEPGDTLAVHFLRIRPTRNWGVSSTFPHFGALTSTHSMPTLQPPLEERVWLYEIDAAQRLVRYRARNTDFTVDLPLEPMHGTIGVAPAGFQALSTITCGTHGGNMDTPELRAGSTLYLGVNVHGALLSLGDGHARQGEGEVSGVGVETAMRTTITVDVLKGVSTAWPRIETDDAVMSVGCARPLEDAYRISQHDLVIWVAEMTGLDTLDALQLVTQAGKARAGNVCDPNYTMLARIDKRYLAGSAPYENVHMRLRETPRPDFVEGRPR